MPLEDLRLEIDRTNIQFADLLQQRLRILDSIRKIKAAENLPLYDQSRTQKMFSDLEDYWQKTKQPSDPNWEQIKPIFSQLFSVSLEYMNK